ncbi:hypothetical protein YC2023_005040 [Brassica napus]
MKDTCKEKRGFILKRTQSNDYSLTLGWMRTKMRYHREHITAERGPLHNPKKLSGGRQRQHNHEEQAP